MLLPRAVTVRLLLIMLPFGGPRNDCLDRHCLVFDGVHDCLPTVTVLLIIDGPHGDFLFRLG